MKKFDPYSKDPVSFFEHPLYQNSMAMEGIDSMVIYGFKYVAAAEQNTELLNDIYTEIQNGADPKKLAKKLNRRANLVSLKMDIDRFNYKQKAQRYRLIFLYRDVASEIEKDPNFGKALSHMDKVYRKSLADLSEIATLKDRDPIEFQDMPVIDNYECYNIMRERAQTDLDRCSKKFREILIARQEINQAE